MSSTPRNPQAKKEARKPENVASRREQLRQQQEAEAAAARRKRLLWALAGVLALALVIGLAVWGFQQLNKPKVTGDGSTAASMTSDKSGFYVAADKAKPGAPEVGLFTDYQCPACKNLEANFGTKLVELARAGEIKLSMHTMTFLDGNLNNDASARSAQVAACVANHSGRYPEYVKAVYDNQPAEGVGYTDDQLLKDYTQQAGLTAGEQEAVQRCYRSGETKSLVQNADLANQKYLFDTVKAVNTPTLMVNGKQLNQESLYDLSNPKNPKPLPEKLLEVIKSTT